MIIYEIKHRESGKSYVGQTVQTLAARWKLHRTAAKRGVKTAIASAIRKYGADAFDLREVERCDTRAALDDAEIRWIETLNSLAPNGYNLRTGGGEAYKLTEEFRNSLRGPRGWKHSEDFKARRSKEERGKPRPPEVVARIAETNRAKSEMTMEKAEAMRRWRVENNATYRQTSEHFGVSFRTTDKILCRAAWV